MTNALSISLSGLTAQGQRMAVAANNIANVATVGTLPAPGAPLSTVYRPLTVSYTALMADGTGAGVRAQVSEDSNGYTAVFDPGSVYANSEGLIAAPNVDLARESINIMESKLLYRANIGALKAQDEMMDDLLNAII